MYRGHTTIAVIIGILAISAIGIVVALITQRMPQQSVNLTGAYNANDNIDEDLSVSADSFAKQHKVEQTQPINNSTMPEITRHLPDHTDLLADYSGVVLHTNKGDITVTFYEDVPVTANNFLNLAEQGFYNDVKFHRVIKDFMIQGGDPNSKNDDAPETWGTGGPDYRFGDEFIEGRVNARGTLSMANAGPGTNGSQFFINVKANNFLDGRHAVFGEVTEGMEVVDTIEASDTDPNDRPIDPVVINTVELIKR